MSYSFAIKGHLSSNDWRMLQRRSFRFSSLNPTGIYVEEGKKIVLDIDKNINNHLIAVIGTHKNYDRTDQERFSLSFGQNIITPQKSGLLYFENFVPESEVNITLKEGGTHIPYFELGKTTNYDFIKQLINTSDVPTVELLGERSLITITLESAKKHLINENIEDLMKKIDQVAIIQDRVSGISTSYPGISSPDPNYLHFIEDTRENGGWMYATNEITGYVTSALIHLLNLNNFKTDGWGPWHECGHLRQQSEWLWDGLSEVTVNIYSLSVQREFGNTSRLETDHVYERVFNYLNQSDDQKDFNNSDLDLFEKLTMFWQLDLAFGKNFYHNLHHNYRYLYDISLPVNSDDEKIQTFIYMTSKTSGVNLIPFFDKWGLLANIETRERIYNSNFSTLTKEIWFNRDSNPIIEKNISILNISKDSRTSMVDLGNVIRFKGLGDDLVCVISADSNTLRVNTSNIQAHYYFGDDEYFSVKLLDKNNRAVKTSATVSGNDNASNFASILNGTLFEDGDILEVHHEEPKDRLVMVRNFNTMDGLNKKTQTFYLTKNGFFKDGLRFNGYSDSLIADLYVKSNNIYVNSTEADAHWYFGDEEYFSVKLLDKHGINVKKSAVVTGNETANNFASALNGVSFEDGDILEVYHEEPYSRLTRIANFEDLYGSHEKIQRFYLINDGFIKDGIRFKGLGDNLIANLYIKNNNIYVNSTNIQSHVYFTDEEYFSVELIDKIDQIPKYSASVKGNETANNFASILNGISFNDGDILYIYHKEPLNRLVSIKNFEKLEGLSNTVQKFLLSKNSFIREI